MKLARDAKIGLAVTTRSRPLTADCSVRTAPVRRLEKAHKIESMEGTSFGLCQLHQHRTCQKQEDAEQTFFADFRDGCTEPADVVDGGRKQHLSCDHHAEKGTVSDDRRTEDGCHHVYYTKGSADPHPPVGDSEAAVIRKPVDFFTAGPQQQNQEKHRTNGKVDGSGNEGISRCQTDLTIDAGLNAGPKADGKSQEGI